METATRLWGRCSQPQTASGKAQASSFQPVDNRGPVSGLVTVGTFPEKRGCGFLIYVFFVVVVFYPSS